ncbi:putative secreted protein (Por secretion system target) [Gelidibacter algens]|uniref:Putative secreted protein (Por secretion system target) n=1 Tax=Gelidibacter algens TaxID=49280 RepID=A0A1A7QND1_9FLAO|nr:T9SS type A sorting domain-containing protein [Gelidibacter algens]OBX20981.1 hypothetical protein A9996_18680 [Gelidibacter algens]RAJ25123.1 putative secreted protein (Por secretion system target) [Gelidibacter algens]
MNKKKYTIILFFSFLSISAQEILDQSQLVYNTYAPIGILDYGQGFTAGSDMKITKIEVLMDCGSSLGCTGQQYNLSLYSASSDSKPIGNALFSQAGIGFDGADGTPVWQSFQLPNGPMMTLGNMYVIIISDNGNSTDFGWLQASDNLYSGGQNIYRVSGSTNSWNTLSSSDLVFKVWIDNTLGVEGQSVSDTNIKASFNSGMKLIKIDSDVNFEASLFDLLGREIMNFDVLSHYNNSFDASNLIKGIYIIKSKTDSVIFSKKICIR